MKVRKPIDNLVEAVRKSGLEGNPNQVRFITAWLENECLPKSEQQSAKALYTEVYGTTGEASSQGAYRLISKMTGCDAAITAFLETGVTFQTLAKRLSKIMHQEESWPASLAAVKLGLIVLRGMAHPYNPESETQVGAIKGEIGLRHQADLKLRTDEVLARATKLTRTLKGADGSEATETIELSVDIPEQGVC